MVQHKIQSSTGLTLELDQVPKMLGKLTQEWAPQSFVVSFKLETDESILFDKAWGAIEKCRVHLVVANILHTRADKCFLVAPFDGNSTDTIADNVRIESVHKHGSTAQHGAANTGNTHDKKSLGQKRSIQTLLREPVHKQIEPLLVREVAAAYRKWLHAQTPSSDSTTVAAAGPITAPAYAKQMAAVQEQMKEYVNLLTLGATASPQTSVLGACCSGGVFSTHNILLAVGVSVVFALGYAAGRAKV